MIINKYINEPFVKGRNIYSNYYTIICNSTILNGDNILLFYNNDNQRIIKTIRGYSFDISHNCLAIIPKVRLKNIKNIGLLYACKKKNKK